MDEINHEHFCLEMINGNGEESRVMKRYSLSAATSLRWVFGWIGGWRVTYRHIQFSSSPSAHDKKWEWRRMRRHRNGRPSVNILCLLQRRKGITSFGVE